MPDKITECPTCGPTTKTHAEHVALMESEAAALRAKLAYIERVIANHSPVDASGSKWAR